MAQVIKKVNIKLDIFDLLTGLLNKWGDG